MRGRVRWTPFSGQPEGWNKARAVAQFGSTRRLARAGARAVPPPRLAANDHARRSAGTPRGGEYRPEGRPCPGRSRLPVWTTSYHGSAPLASARATSC